MAVKRAALIALAATACAQDPLLIAPPWDDEAQVVLLVDGEVRSVIAGQSAAFDFDDVVDRELVALAYPSTASGLPDLATCGVTLDGGDVLPPANAAWRVVVRDDTDRPTFEPSDVRPALALLRCTYDPCPETTTASWPLGDEDDEIRGLTFLPDGDLLIALGDADRGGEVIRWRDGEPVWRHTYDDYVKGIGWDGAEKIYAGMGQSLVALDLEGRTATPARTFDDVEQVRSDGVGGVAVRRQSGIASVDGAWPDLAGDFHALAIVPGGTGLAADSRGLWRLDGGWLLEFRDAAFGNVGGDEQTLVALNEVGERITFTNGRWEDFEGPDTPGLLVVRGRGDGRLVLAGNLGQLRFAEGDGWCAAPTGTGQRIESLAVSYDGRTFAVGGAPSEEHPDETPVLAIVSVLD
jgi:hypothetical protein